LVINGWLGCWVYFWFGLIEVERLKHGGEGRDGELVVSLNGIMVVVGRGEKKRGTKKGRRTRQNC
jgi:hypothetical protein